MTRNEYQRLWRKERGEDARAYDRAQYHKHKNKRNEWYATYRSEKRHKVICTRAQNRAKKNNTPFDLTPEYIESIWPSDNRCPVFGMEFDFSAGRGTRDASPSIDRIDPNLGYTKGNVAIISGKANRIKSNATPDDIRAVADYFDKLVVPVIQH